MKLILFLFPMIFAFFNPSNGYGIEKYITENNETTSINYTECASKAKQDFVSVLGVCDKIINATARISCIKNMKNVTGLMIQICRDVTDNEIRVAPFTSEDIQNTGVCKGICRESHSICYQKCHNERNDDNLIQRKQCFDTCFNQFIYCRQNICPKLPRNLETKCKDDHGKKYPGPPRVIEREEYFLRLQKCLGIYVIPRDTKYPISSMEAFKWTEKNSRNHFHWLTSI